MKRIISVLVSAAIIFSLGGFFPGDGQTVHAETEGIYTYIVSDGKATITACEKSASGAITIPSTLGGYPVTSIEEWTFSVCRSLISVIIPNSVTSIGALAFYGCSSLTSITIPDSVTSIGDEAFSECVSLTSIHVNSANQFYSSQDGILFNKSKTFLVAYPAGKGGVYSIPNSVTSIGDGAFYYCAALTSIIIPDSVTSIGGWVFYRCSGLTSIIIPDSVTSIGSSAFEGCYNLTSVTIPNSVTSIGNRAFYYCAALTSIIIPDSVTSIGGSAFYYCTALTSIIIPDSVTSIGEWAFYSCAGLTSIIIPDSVTSIERWAFYRCTGLMSVAIPNSVTSIGDLAFYGCTGLTSVTIPNSVTSIGNKAFAYCDNVILTVEENSYAHLFAVENRLQYVLKPNPYNWDIYNERITEGIVYFDISTKLEQIDEYPVIIIGMYGEGDMLADIIKIDCEEGKNQYTANIGIREAFDETETVKIFLWTSAKAIEPLTGLKTLNL